MTINTKAQVKFTEALPEFDLNKGPVTSVLNRLNAVIAERIQMDADSGNAPQNDREYDPLRKLADNRNVASLFTALKIDPRGYFLAPYLTEAERVKAGLPSDYRARNLKAIAKLSEMSDFIMSGLMRREAVLHTWSACAVVTSRHGTLDRATVERFISSASLDGMKADLREAIEEYRANHMTGGAATQTSQVTQVLYALGGLDVARNGMSKVYKAKRESLVLSALATRYGLQERFAA